MLECLGKLVLPVRSRQNQQQIGRDQQMSNLFNELLTQDTSGSF
jgi:hypothetical protein